MAFIQYNLLPQSNSHISEKDIAFKDTDEPFQSRSQRQSSSLRHRRGLFISLALLCVSLAVNLFFICRQFISPWDLLNELPTRYGESFPTSLVATMALMGYIAHLSRNVPTRYVRHSEFASTNRTIQDSAWESDPRMRTWEAFISLNDESATSKGLPHSQRWPWDHNKGVYIFSGAHELHCTVRRTISQKHHI